MGLGDVKLAGVLGVYLGTQVIEAMPGRFRGGIGRRGWFCSCGTAGRRASRTIPFAPFLAIGALAAVATQP